MKIPAAGVSLEADLTDGEHGLVVFAHGSGSSRRSPRNRQVAAALNTAGFGTLLFDLLTPDEELEDTRTARLRFDIPLLARRLSAVVGWAATRPVGLFGASTGAAAALVTAAECPDDVAAVVSRGGRPDLAGEALAVVRAPTLLIVGGRDLEVLSLNERAAARMSAEKAIVVVPGAGHLFAEPGALEEVARLAENWFARHMRG
ncbi:dienelactone hydrolase family protein [Actinoallomurus acanthiterrae]